MQFYFFKARFRFVDFMYIYFTKGGAQRFSAIFVSTKNGEGDGD
jgi:hypothetical protein